MAKRSLYISAKFERSMLRMKREKWELVGLLDTLWYVTGQECPQGDIGRLSNEDIALAMGYSGDPDELIEQLIKSKWLDGHSVHRLIVHDWAVHCEDYIHMSLARRGLAFADGTPASETRLSAKQRQAIEDRKRDDTVRTPKSDVRTTPESVRIECAQTGQVCEENRNTREGLASPSPLALAKPPDKPVEGEIGPIGVAPSGAGPEGESCDSAGPDEPKKPKRWPKRGTGPSDADAKRAIAKRLEAEDGPDHVGQVIAQKAATNGKHPSEAEPDKAAHRKLQLAIEGAVLEQSRLWRERTDKSETRDAFAVRFAQEHPGEAQLLAEHRKEAS